MITWREGELLAKQRLEQLGFIVTDVSNDPVYQNKDIDLVAYNPNNGHTATMEVKTDNRIAKTGNLYLEIVNMNSKQWNYDGWWLRCQADYLVYIDAINGKQYIIPLLELREKIEHMPKQIAQCGNDSIGQLVALSSLKDIYKIL